MVESATVDKKAELDSDSPSIAVLLRNSCMYHCTSQKLMISFQYSNRSTIQKFRMFDDTGTGTTSCGTHHDLDYTALQLAACHIVLNLW